MIVPNVTGECFTNLCGCFGKVTYGNPKKKRTGTLPETNIAHENPIFPGKYHQNGGFSMAMLVSGSVSELHSTLYLLT